MCIISLISFLFSFLFLWKIYGRDHSVWAYIDIFWVFAAVVAASFAVAKLQASTYSFLLQKNQIAIATEVGDLKSSTNSVLKYSGILNRVDQSALRVPYFTEKFLSGLRDLTGFMDEKSYLSPNRIQSIDKFWEYVSIHCKSINVNYDLVISEAKANINNNRLFYEGEVLDMCRVSESLVRHAAAGREILASSEAYAIFEADYAKFWFLIIPIAGSLRLHRSISDCRKIKSKSIA